MENKKILQNPRSKANFFSVLFFGYTFQLFNKGFKKKLVEEDIYNPLNADRSELLGDKLQRKWLKQLNKTNGKPSLLKALIETFWRDYFFTAILFIQAEIVLRLSEPVLFGYVLKYFQPDSKMTEEVAFWYFAGLILEIFTRTIVTGQHEIYDLRNGMRSRIACSSLVYSKILKLSQSATDEVDAGKLINLLSNDMSRFDLTHNLHYIWGGPVVTICVAWLLYLKAGFTGLLGILLIAVVTIVQCFTGKLMGTYREKTSHKSDDRIKLMEEIVSGIQTIKMYGWEKSFAKLVANARKSELKIIQKSSYLRGLFMTFNAITPPLALFVTLVLTALLKVDIVVSNVYVAITYFNLLNLTASTICILAIANVAELKECINRIESFLLAQENVPLINNGDDYSQAKLNLNNVTSSWSLKSQKNILISKEATSPDENTKLLSHDMLEKNLDKSATIGNGYKQISDQTPENNVQNSSILHNKKKVMSDNVLKNITLSAYNRSFIGIIGAVGCGKTSLLHTILGETFIKSGTISVEGKVSYACQTSWIFADTIRENILFGLEHDKRRYHEVVKACCLDQDFKTFSNGDMTLVGDRGASLSGGQKARINLARAVYRQADIYLMDDPLAAVDVQVAKSLYEKCINKFLKDKCRILVTHHVQFLNNADQVILINNGTIEERGSLSELSENGRTYSKLQHLEDTKLLKSFEKSLNDSKSTSFHVSLANTEKYNFEEYFDTSDKLNLIDAEKKDGKAKNQSYLLLKYLRSGGNWFTVFIMLLLFVISQLGISLADLFVSYWTNIEEKRRQNQLSDQLLSVEFFLYVYAGLSVFFLLFSIIRSIFFFKFVTWCSQKLHDNVFDKVVNAEMKFFNTNTTGTILNRFSKDLGAVDVLLPKTLIESLQIILTFVAALIIVVFINPYFLIAIIITSAICLTLNYVYLNSTLDIKRLEGKMMGPLYTHVNTSFNGLITIRALEKQNLLQHKFHSLLDRHSGAWFMYLTTSVAFGFFIDMSCFVFLGAVTCILLVFRERMGLSGSQVGLAITQAMALSGVVQWGIRQVAETGNYLISVERILTYNKLPQESQSTISKDEPKNWPSCGKMIFKNVSLRYDIDAPRVLNNLNFVIKPKEKIGVIGRTGAGKSSLISAIFKLAHVEGTIEIDGIDTNDISLQTLRSKISIIPQDPVLFSGTLRYNLDPFDEYDDIDLYRAISEVELKDSSKVLFKLESAVTDRGANYSVGQKQLICLARAIIRKNKILLLDEATANVDLQTDEFIQTTLRNKFTECTVLTVAHRLNTIIDCDRILVVDSGRILEFDHPHILLQNPENKFSKMAAEMGSGQLESLKKIAEKNYKKHKVEL